MMRNKEIRKPKEIVMPEIEIHGLWGKTINWVSRIKPFYWLMIILCFLALFITLVPYQIWIDVWLSLKSQATLISLALVFTLISVSLVWSTGQKLDVWVFMLFNMQGHRTPILDWIMIGFTQIGNGVFAMSVAAVLFLSGNQLLSYELAFGTLTLWLIVEFLKIVFFRARPFNKLTTIRIVGSKARGQSFPSGHTSQSFFMATLLLHYFQFGAYIWILIYLIALLVGITRIYIGMHYPRDVLGGAILGTAWGLFGVIINNYIWTIS